MKATNKSKEEIKKMGKMGRPPKQLKELADINLNDEFYTIDEVAKILKVEHRTIRRAIKRGDIKAMKVGRQYRIRKSDFQ